MEWESREWSGTRVGVPGSRVGVPGNPWGSVIYRRNGLSKNIWLLLEVRDKSVFNGYYSFDVVEFYRKYGRIPWVRIFEHPDHFLDNRSHPETDHGLQEPSRMTEIAVNAWLKHWLTHQQKSTL